MSQSLSDLLSQAIEESGLEHPNQLMIWLLEQRRFDVADHLYQSVRLVQQLSLSMETMQWLSANGESADSLQIHEAFQKQVHALLVLQQLFPEADMHPAVFLARREYLVQDVFGAGVNGTVIEAVYVPNYANVAIKLNTTLNHLVMEVAMQDVFHKSGLAPMIYDTFVGELGRMDIGCIVMQIESTTLKSFLHELFALDSMETNQHFLPIIIEMLQEAMSTMSQHHLIHADLKPDNIVLNVERRARGVRINRLRLIDFGWAYINHRADPWPEWLWFVVGILLKCERYPRHQGYQLFWSLLRQHDGVRASIGAFCERMQPGAEVWSVIDRQPSVSDVLALLLPFKEELDRIMKREYRRFSAHCEQAVTMPVARGVVAQHEQRLLHDAVPANSIALQEVLRNALACIEVIRNEHDEEYRDVRDETD